MTTDSEAFDMLVQMHGDLSWNPLMAKWVATVPGISCRDVFASDENPNAAVASAHGQWLRLSAKAEAEMEGAA